MTGFLLIDRLVVLRPGERAVATKTFAADDPIFRDHFPGYPVVPGTLLVEAMAQTAGWLIAATTGFTRSTQLVLVKDAKFRRVVRPGTAIELSAAIAATRGAIYDTRTEARAEGDLAASARLVLQTFDWPASDASREFEAWARDTFRAIGGEALLNACKS